MKTGRDRRTQDAVVRYLATFLVEERLAFTVRRPQVLCLRHVPDAVRARRVASSRRRGVDGRCRTCCYRRAAAPPSIRVLARIAVGSNDVQRVPLAIEPILLRC
jgi:hypothetical protein